MPATPSSAEPPPAGPRRLSRRARIGLVVASVAVPAALLGVVLGLDADDESGAPVIDTPPGDLQVAEPGRAEIGTRAPDFTLPSLDGLVVALSDHRGRAVVLTFFASWCHPCEEEMPLLEDAAREHRDDLTVLAVSYQDLRGDTERFVERLGVTFPALWDGDQAVARAYGVRGIPQTFFIDAEGVIRDRVFGITTESALAEPLAALLQADEAA